MPNPYYRAVMFDFDGTLIDTMHAYADIAAHEMALVYGMKTGTARKLYIETSGVPFFQQLQLIFGEDARNPVCAERFEKEKEVLLKDIRLTPQTRKTLKQIREQGISTAITSNNYQSLVDSVTFTDRDLFDLVLGFGTGMSKGPSQFACVMDTFGLDRRHLLFVGDSLSDVYKGLAFGVDFMAVAGTLPPERFVSVFPFVPVISELTELIDLLKENKPLRREEFQ